MNNMANIKGECFMSLFALKTFQEICLTTIEAMGTGITNIDSTSNLAMTISGTTIGVTMTTADRKDIVAT